MKLLLQDKKYLEYDSIIFEEWYYLWLKNYKYKMVKESTIFLYQNCYDRYIRFSLGSLFLNEIRNIHIQNLFNQMLSSNLGIGTLQIVRRILNNIFSTAVKCDYLKKNPCIGTILPRDQKKRPNVLTLQEQKLFLEAVEGDFYSSLYHIALSTGLRIGELTALTWDDINITQQFIDVNKTLLYQKSLSSHKYEYRIQTPKSESSKRMVPLIPEACDVLIDHRIQQSKWKNENTFRWKPLPDFENLVFTSRNGTPIQEVYIVKHLAKMSTHINILEKELAEKENRMPLQYERIVPHTLRHTFATRAFENGMAPKMVQELMGHSNLSITMDLYTHVTWDAKVKEIKKMEGILQFI